MTLVLFYTACVRMKRRRSTELPLDALSVVAKYRNFLMAAAGKDDTLWCATSESTSDAQPHPVGFNAKYRLVSGHLVPLVGRLSSEQQKAAIQRIFNLIGGSNMISGWTLVLFVALATALRMEIGFLKSCPSFRYTGLTICGSKTEFHYNRMVLLTTIATIVMLDGNNNGFILRVASDHPKKLFLPCFQFELLCVSLLLKLSCIPIICSPMFTDSEVYLKCLTFFCLISNSRTPLLESHFYQFRDIERILLMHLSTVKVSDKDQVGVLGHAICNIRHHQSTSSALYLLQAVVGLYSIVHTVDLANESIIRSIISIHTPVVLAKYCDHLVQIQKTEKDRCLVVELLELARDGYSGGGDPGLSPIDVPRTG